MMCNCIAKISIRAQKEYPFGRSILEGVKI